MDELELSAISGRLLTIPNVQIARRQINLADNTSHSFNRHAAAMRALFERRIETGCLYLVSTPIGNLADISMRGLSVLAQADYIACEDTRVIGKLLHYFSIQARLIAYHDHNAHRQGPLIINHLKAGKTIALVSDAGTPLICDPGYRLINHALAAGCKIVPIPGACAPIAALSAAGLASDSFIFAGFIPSKSPARRTFFEKWAPIEATLVFFDTPKRIATSLKDAADIMGNQRQAVIARELTKLYEAFHRASLKTLASIVKAEPNMKGELVLLIEGARPPPVSLEAMDEALKQLLQQMSVKDASLHLSDTMGLSRRTLYKRALRIRNHDQASEPATPESPL